MDTRVPFVAPKLHYQNLKAEIDAAITGCLSQGDLICRQQLRDFEEHLAAFVGVKYAVGVNSGYHALEFSLRAAGIGAGDEVITVAHTFVATVSAIVNCGATPVLVEVKNDFTLDPVAFESAISERTRSVIPVHLNGRICEMDQIMEIANRYGLIVIEDACQALGAHHRGRNAGSIGLTGCWSFYPFKILGGFGDGGAITTNDPDVARFARLLRYNGEDRETGDIQCHGFTALLDNVQAAVLDVKLRHLRHWIDHRREIAHLYSKELSDLPFLVLPAYDGDGHYDVFQNYVVMTPERDSLREYLRSCGIETLISWPKPLWSHRGLRLADPQLPFTEAICRQAISLPMSAETTAEEVHLVSDSIHRFFSNQGTNVRVTAATLV